jgi:DUF917 family protein
MSSNKRLKITSEVKVTAVVTVVETAGEMGEVVQRETEAAKWTELAKKVAKAEQMEAGMVVELHWESDSVVTDSQLHLPNGSAMSNYSWPTKCGSWV